LMLARAYANQGILLSLAGRNAESAGVLQVAADTQRRLVAWNPRVGQFRHGLAMALLHSGRVDIELGRPATAEPALRGALDGMQQLVRDDALASEYAVTRLRAAARASAH